MGHYIDTFVYAYEMGFVFEAPAEPDYGRASSGRNEAESRVMTSRWA